MTNSIKHLNDADLVILDGSDNQWIGYWFDEGISLCVRTLDTSESYVMKATREELVEEAVGLLNEHNATNENGGEVPGYSECESCCVYFEHYLCSTKYCKPCHDAENF